MKEEIWKDIKNCKGYQVSNKSKVKVLSKKVKTGIKNQTYVTRKEKILKPYIAHGYYQVNLWINGKYKHYQVHRLVAEAFIPNPENKPQVNHIDGNKLNNDISNLEWVTRSENMKHAFKNGLAKPQKGVDNILSLTVIQSDLEGNVLNKYGSTMEAERQTGINHSNISKCCRGVGRYKTAGGFKWEYENII